MGIVETLRFINIEFVSLNMLLLQNMISSIGQEWYLYILRVILSLEVCLNLELFIFQPRSAWKRTNQAPPNILCCPLSINT